MKMPINPNNIRKAVNEAAKLGFDRVRLDKSLTELAALNASGDYRKSLYVAGRLSFGVIAFRLNYKFSRERMALTGYEARLMTGDQVPAKHWEFTSATPLVAALKKVIQDLGIKTPKPKITELLTGVNTPQISPTMNLNNLQDLKREIKELGFDPKIADELEKNMRADAKYFTLKDSLPGDKGQVDMTLHFSKAQESEFYNFRKYEAVAGKVPPTVDNQQYMVFTENKADKEKPLVKTFDSPNDALIFFKKQTGTSELALGESPESKQILASKEKGTVNYVDENFKEAYYASAVKQNFYLSNGAGFTASQAANMVQGRTVHRENMINPKNGEMYNAWIKLDIAQGKDDWGNFKLKQMNDPNFGFNLEKTLDGFKIKELADPAKKAEVIAAMKNGDRVELTAVNKEIKRSSYWSKPYRNTKRWISIRKTAVKKNGNCTKNRMLPNNHRAKARVSPKRKNRKKPKA